MVLSGPAGLPAVIPSLAFAQEKYPSRPITWICPYGAGGNIGTELIAGGTPEQSATLIRTEASRWARVVKEAKIGPE